MMRRFARFVMLGSVIVLLALMLVPRLSPLLQDNSYALATARSLVASDDGRLFWDVCFRSTPSAGQPGGEMPDRPPILPAPTEPALSGRRLLWKFLAQAGQVGLPGIEVGQSESLDAMFSQLAAGCAAMDRQQLQEAAAYFTHLPGLARGLARLGDSEESAGRYETAGKAWYIASRNDHAAADIHYGYASFLRRHGGPPGDILRELHEAVKLAPGNWIYRTALGEVYQEQGQSAQAIQAFSEALNFAPDQGAVYFQRGLAYQAIGELPQACADIQQAIALDAARRDVYTQALCALCTRLEVCQQK